MAFDAGSGDSTRDAQDRAESSGGNTQAERDFQWSYDPHMTNYYGPEANAAVKVGNAAFNASVGQMFPGLGLINTASGLLGGPTVAGWIRDKAAKQGLAKMMGTGGTTNSLGTPTTASAGGDGMGLWDVVGSVGGALVGGLFGQSAANKQTSAAKDAAAASAEATRYAADLQNKQFQQQRTDLMPWMTVGKNALARMYAGIKDNGQFMQPFTMDKFQADPGYQFRLSEGIKALDRSASAKGNLLSGSALKGVTQYGQDMASQEYQNAYNRYVAERDAKFNKLASIAGTGQTTATQLGNAGTTYASNQGNLALGNAATQGNAALAAANARASSYAGWGNALSQGIAGITDYLGNRG